MAKVWFITGTSRGLGRSIAEEVLQRGDLLVATARKPEQLSDLKEKYGEQVRTVALDVRDADQARAAVAVAVEAFGRINVVVNNAGYGNLVSIEESTEEEFRDQIETNLWGVINVTRAVLPVLRKQRAGHILQVTSIGGRIGAAGLGAYQTAKWGVEGFSEVLAKEVAPFGVKVIIVEPGAMMTDWAGSSMKVTLPGEEYRASMGWVLDRLQEMEAASRASKPVGSDLGKVSRVLWDIVNEPEPPLRLLIGSDALHMALATDEAKLVETRKWQAISASTDAT